MSVWHITLRLPAIHYPLLPISLWPSRCSTQTVTFHFFRKWNLFCPFQNNPLRYNALVLVLGPILKALLICSIWYGPDLFQRCGLSQTIFSYFRLQLLIPFRKTTTQIFGRTNHLHLRVQMVWIVLLTRFQLTITFQ